MQGFLLRMAALMGVLLATAACHDVTLPHYPAADLSATAPLHDEEYQSLACCDPVIVVAPGPVEPPCDPYTDLNWCDGSGGDCMTSMEGEESYGMFGCSGGGTGGATSPTCPITDPYCAGGSGGTGTQPSDPDDGCNPQYDPDCNQPLSSADSATLRLARQRHLRPASAFTNPAAAQQCAAMLTEFDRLYAAGLVFRGRTDTPDGDPLTPSHVGAFDPVSGTMHFEPSALDAANGGDAAAIRSLLNTALHESAHALGYDHSDPLWAGDYDLYAEAPFDLLSPGTNSCLIS
jgi:hypothetical protein